MPQRSTPREDQPPARQPVQEPIAPPTIGFLRAQGVHGFRVACAGGNCVRSAIVGFEAAGLPDDLPFPAIGRGERLVCSACGGRTVHLMPDWPNPQAREPSGRNDFPVIERGQPKWLTRAVIKD